MYRILTATGPCDFDSPAAVLAAVRSQRITDKQIIRQAGKPNIRVHEFLAAAGLLPSGLPTPPPTTSAPASAVEAT